jgi:hypothetical protein
MLSKQMFPVGRTATAGVGTVPLACLSVRPLPRSYVVEIPDEEFNDLADELARLVLADVGQVFELDFSGFAAVPTIWLPGFGMDSGDDDLLPVTEKFDFLRARVRRGDVGDDLRERFNRTK